MKTLFVSLVACLTVTIFISCGGPSNENKKTADTSSSASNMMKESTYDPTKIDAAAPVSEITLHATGNTMDQMKYDLPEIST